MTIPEPEAPPPPATAPVEPPTPQWLRNLTHLAAIGWTTCELAFWGARAYPLLFITLVFFGTSGVQALANLRRLTQ